MQDKHLFEYAVIRVVPRVEREEFVNVGIVVFCKKQKFLQARFHLNSEKALSLFPQLDLDDVKEHLSAFEKISAGSKNAGPIAQLDAASRFRWLTATRSTIVQTSKVHPGFCEELSVVTEKLFNQLVL